MPPGLVELIESRIGALPAPVSDVIDVLAVGEPIELGALTRITNAAAVEKAETRGLITLEPAGGGIEVRVAHPLYGQVRRRRAAHSRLRRLRGLVASELAASSDRDDIRVVVRRATLSLDSDLTARRRPARQGSARRRLAGGPAPSGSTSGSGNPRRSGTGNRTLFVRTHYRGLGAARRRRLCSPTSAPAS